MPMCYAIHLLYDILACVVLCEVAFAAIFFCGNLATPHFDTYHFVQTDITPDYQCLHCNTHIYLLCITARYCEKHLYR